MKLWIEAFFSSLAVRTKILWYINGPQTLPPPLSEKEEQYIFENWESKDRTIKEKMIVHNLRLVIYIAKKFENSAVSVEDLTSIVCLGII